MLKRSILPSSEFKQQVTICTLCSSSSSPLLKFCMLKPWTSPAPKKYAYQQMKSVYTICKFFLLIIKQIEWTSVYRKFTKWNHLSTGKFDGSEIQWSRAVQTEWWTKMVLPFHFLASNWMAKDHSDKMVTDCLDDQSRNRAMAGILNIGD